MQQLISRSYLLHIYGKDKTPTPITYPTKSSFVTGRVTLRSFDVLLVACGPDSGTRMDKSILQMGHCPCLNQSNFRGAKDDPIRLIDGPFQLIRRYFSSHVNNLKIGEWEKYMPGTKQIHPVAQSPQNPSNLDSETEHVCSCAWVTYFFVQLGRCQVPDASVMSDGSSSSWKKTKRRMYVNYRHQDPSCLGSLNICGELSRSSDRALKSPVDSSAGSGGTA